MMHFLRRPCWRSVRLLFTACFSSVFLTAAGTPLQAGGVQRLYAGRLTEGEHRLDVSLSGRLARKKAFQQQRSVTITKMPGRKYMELQLGPGEEKSQPGVTVREWQQ